MTSMVGLDRYLFDGLDWRKSVFIELEGSQSINCKQLRTMTIRWSLILFLGVCSLHWTTGEWTARNCIYVTTEYNNYKKTLTGLEEASHWLCSRYTTEVLYLNNLQLQRISENAFRTVPFLKMVDLSNNEIDIISPMIFSELTDLRELNLKRNKLKYFYMDFLRFKNFRRLNLSCNQLWGFEERKDIHLSETAEIIIIGNVQSWASLEEPGNAKRIATLNQLIANSTAALNSSESGISDHLCN